ncbi:insulinase family protein [Micromonospora chersina]|uniref:insulinase family protein n=1 Tax=Micromonospora chersina TaxID=47854 RepID=UPI0034021BC2
MIRREVDGVPALFVKAGGPVRAGLVFRVGRVDEPLPLAGVTHLVEHLALYRHGLMDHHANASVGSTVSHFYTAGTPAEVVAFFQQLCASLADLPVARMEVEKEILLTEAAGRSNGVNANLPLWRYGAQGHGQVSYAEFGLHRVTADDLRDWAAEHFTRDNAVLWVAGNDVPADLRLDLPAGARRPLPPPTSALQSTPAYYHAAANGVVMDTVVRRGTAAQLFAAVLERALYRQLRLESGVSYTATTDYSPRGDDMATITAYVDALPQKKAAALHGFVDTVKLLARSGVAQEELDAVRTMALASLDDPDFEMARLPTAAVDLLTGQPLFTAAELGDRLRSVAAADVTAVAAEAYARALLQVPYEVSADALGLAAAPTTSESLVAGRRYPSRGDDGLTLVVGDDGVSLVTKAGHALTVRFADCPVRLRWPDGASTFIGADGISVAVEPTLYRVDDAALAALDRAVPDVRTVPMPERSPDHIPRPEQSQRTAPPARKVEFGILAVLTAVVLAGFVGMASAWRPEDGALSERLLLLLMGLSGLGVIRVALLGFGRLRTGRW